MEFPPPTSHERLARLLSAEDAEILADALDAVRRTSAGWGKLQLTIKAGHIDCIIAASSLRRKRKLIEIPRQK